MSGGQQQTTQQSSQTNPWAPTIPMLQSILGQLGQGNLGPTGAQKSAIDQIMSQAGQTPSFAGQGIDAVNKLFGTNTNEQQDMLRNAYNQSSAALQPMLSSNWMDPSTNPYFGKAMSTLNSDITNQIAGQDAAAGRPLTTNAQGTQALARGLGQGEAGLLANEINTLAGQPQAAARLLPQVADGTGGAL